MTDKHEQNPTSAVNFVEKIPCPFDEVNIEANLVHILLINKIVGYPRAENYIYLLKLSGFLKNCTLLMQLWARPASL